MTVETRFGHKRRTAASQTMRFFSLSVEPDAKQLPTHFYFGKELSRGGSVIPTRDFILMGLNIFQSYFKHLNDYSVSRG